MPADSSCTEFHKVNIYTASVTIKTGTASRTPCRDKHSALLIVSSFFPRPVLGLSVVDGTPGIYAFARTSVIIMAFSHSPGPEADPLRRVATAPRYVNIPHCPSWTEPLPGHPWPHCRRSGVSITRFRQHVSDLFMAFSHFPRACGIRLALSGASHQPKVPRRDKHFSLLVLSSLFPRHVMCLSVADPTPA